MSEIVAQIMQLNHPDDVLRLSTLDFDWTDAEGREWLGGANVLDMEGRGPTTAIDGGEFVVTWNGASGALQQKAQHPGMLRARFWMATVRISRADVARIGVPYDEWVGFCEKPEIDSDPGRPTITLRVSSPLMDLFRPRTRMLSAEAQRRVDATDTGADFVKQLRDGNPGLRA